MHISARTRPPGCWALSVLSAFSAAACAHAAGPGPRPPVRPAAETAGAVAPSATPAPSCDDAAHRALDFWLGDWDVAIRSRSSPESTEWTASLGTNRVRAILGRCAVQETFHADGPPAPWNGTSLSTYDPAEKAWRQTWVDDSGAYLAFRGGVEGDTFVLYGEPRAVGGRPRQMRMVFGGISAGALLWTWEAKVDALPWATVMEIRYTRR